MTLVRPVQNAIGILRLLASNPKSVTATFVARELGINGSTCFNILRTLVHLGVTDFEPATKTYRSGLGALGLADKSLLTDKGLRPETYAQLEHFAQKYGVTIMVFRRISENRSLLTGVIDSTAPVRIHARLGQRFPLLAGSAGSVWAAFGSLTDKQIEQQWPQVRWNVPMTLPQFLAQVAGTRKRKLATDDGNHIAGMYTASVPVFRPDGSLLSVVTVGWPRGQLDASTVRQLSTGLKQLLGHGIS